MSKAAATTAANELREVLLSYGVPTTIELMEGRGGQGWIDDRFVATLGHHIVSTRSQGLTPGLRICKFGRSDLPGPLCNGYGGFDEVARIICMGWANHPGQGGPFPTPSGVIPENNGRPYLFGWEFEGGLKESDWTESYHEFMAKCLAASLQWLGKDQRSHLDHKHWATPPGRKTDRLNYTLEEARQRIGDVMAWKSNDGYSYTDDETWGQFSDAIKWNINTGLMKGRRNEATKTAVFDPNAELQRDEAASVFFRFAKDAGLVDEVED